LARVKYVLDAVSRETTAPAGYYVPREEGFLDYQDRKVLYTLGDVCIETSCCGTGSWSYVRVHGYLVGEAASQDEQGTPSQAEQGAPSQAEQGTPSQAEPGRRCFEIDTIEDLADRVAICRQLMEKHPGARVEFR